MYLDVIKKKIFILGTRGIPAQHGGFETFAEKLSVYLRGKGWEVFVYCQEDFRGAMFETDWNGIHRIHFPVESSGSLGTVIFDYKSIIHSLKQDGLFLTLGYKTAILKGRHRLRGKRNVINMDGIEWRRDKWGKVAKSWFWMNERLGCWVGNHLIADHPKIKEHLASRVDHEKISMVPYGADEVCSADTALLRPYRV